MTSQGNNDISPRPPSLRGAWVYLLELILIGAGYFALAKLGLMLAVINPSASPIWPPTGLAIGALLLRGPGAAPAVFAGAFLANVTTAGNVPTSVAIGVGNTFEALVVVWLLRQWAPVADVFSTPLRVVKFAACAVPGTMVSATVGVTALALAGFAFWPDVPAIWMTWWLGDLTGALIVAPTVVLWARPVRPVERRSGMEVAAIYLSAGVASLLAFSPLIADPGYRDPLGFFAVAPLLWAALRADRRATTAVVLVLAAGAVWGTSAGVGPFVRSNLNESFLMVLMFLISISVPSLVLSADVIVRRRSEARLRTARAQLDRRVQQRTEALASARRALEFEIEQRRQAEADLGQAQKMEAVGQVTGGIAHDFNNLLMIVGGHADILHRHLDDPKLRRSAEAIQAAARRGENLTRQLLTFSRRQRLSPSVIDLREHIEAMRAMLVSSLRDNIAFECNVGPGVWPVDVDVGEFELALVNIAVNARDAMPEGGRFTVTVQNVAALPGSSAARDYVAIEMSDTGAGVPPETLPRIFDPFFTTKPIGKGTGLGLSQVYGFAHQSGGAVTATSRVGEGTTVTIYLPRSHRPFARAGTDGPEIVDERTTASSGLVLVVEDNAQVAEVTSALLGQLGYDVLRVENAAEALAVIARGEPIDLVFSDIVMPGMDGIALGRLLRERHPKMPVLLTSGYSDAAQTAEEHFAILRKPFEISALDRMIRAAMAAAASPSDEGAQSRA